MRFYLWYWISFWYCAPLNVYRLTRHMHLFHLRYLLHFCVSYIFEILVLLPVTIQS